MKFEYTGRHIEVTPALKSHVEELFSRISHLFDGKTAKAHVIIEVERGRHRSEIIVKWRNDVITANTTQTDMYQSLTQTVGKIEKQALKFKDKVIDKSHKRQKTAAAAPPAIADVEPAPRPGKRIIDARTYAVKPLTAEEAAMQLEDEENQFLVFRNSENEKFAVVYKRRDGNYGLIQP